MTVQTSIQIINHKETSTNAGSPKQPRNRQEEGSAGKEYRIQGSTDDEKKKKKNEKIKLRKKKTKQ